MKSLRHVHVGIDKKTNPHNLPVARQRLHAVRGAFLAIFENNEESLKEKQLKQTRKARKILKDQHNGSDIHLIPDTHNTKILLKQTSKDVLELIGVDYNNAPTQSLHTLAVRYKKMDNDKFYKRFQNGKVFRDLRFIVYVLRFYGRFGYSGIMAGVKIARKGGQTHTKLRHDAPAIEALVSIFEKADSFSRQGNNKEKTDYVSEIFAYIKERAKLYKDPKAIQEK